MTDILDEAAAVVQCKECPWYRSCVMTLRFTPDDRRRQMEASPMGLPAQAQEMQQLMASMAAAAQNVLLEACPIFIQRLRASPKPAHRLADSGGSGAEEWGVGSRVWGLGFGPRPLNPCPLCPGPCR